MQTQTGSAGHTPNPHCLARKDTHDCCIGQYNSNSPNYKGSILHRYLNDTYEQSISLKTEEGDSRTRNPSGSLSSHDYEEISTTSSSPAHNSFEGMNLAHLL